MKEFLASTGPCMSSSMFEYTEGCTDFNMAIQKLDNLLKRLIKFSWSTCWLRDNRNHTGWVFQGVGKAEEELQLQRPYQILMDCEATIFQGVKSVVSYIHIVWADYIMCDLPTFYSVAEFHLASIFTSVLSFVLLITYFTKHFLHT